MCSAPGPSVCVCPQSTSLHGSVPVNVYMYFRSGITVVFKHGYHSPIEAKHDNNNNNIPKQ